MNYILRMAAIAAMAGQTIPDKKVLPLKKSKKCLLKDCNKLTLHNGGYCCAEHCKKDRNKRYE